MDAVRALETEVRELLRRSNLDPLRDEPAVRRLVQDAVSDYDERSMHGGMAVIPDLAAASKAVWDSVVGFGPLQQYFDDPHVEEIWVNEPSRVFVARDGVAELTTTLLTADEVRDLVERMLKSSGRRVDLSSPFVDAVLPDGSRLHVVIPDITREHWYVNVRKFVVKADSMDDLVRLGSLTGQAARFLEAAVAAVSTSSCPVARKQARPPFSTAWRRRCPRASASSRARRSSSCASRTGTSRRCSVGSRRSRVRGRSRCGGWSRRRCACGPRGSSSARCARPRAWTS